MTNKISLLATLILICGTACLAQEASSTETEIEAEAETETETVKEEEKSDPCNLDWKRLDPGELTQEHLSFPAEGLHFYIKWQAGEKLRAMSHIEPHGSNFLRSVWTNMSDMNNAQKKKYEAEILKALKETCEYDKKADIFVKSLESKFLCKKIEPLGLVRAEGFLAVPPFQGVFCGNALGCYSSKSTISFNKLDAWRIRPDEDLDRGNGFLFLDPTRLSCEVKQVDSPIGKGLNHTCSMVLSKKMENRLIELNESEERWSLYACIKGPFKIATQDKKKKDSKNFKFNSDAAGFLLMKGESLELFERFKSP